jgi:hypothetical protein
VREFGALLAEHGIERPVAHPADEKISFGEPTGEGSLDETLVASIARNEAE